MAEYVSDVIARADSKGKILDFRNNMILAKSEHYAMMVGTGGAKFAPNSTIKVCMTDYSAGTGDKSINVDANISPGSIMQMLAVCEQNVGEIYIPQPISDAPIIRALNSARAALKSATVSVGDEDEQYVTFPRNKLIEIGKLITAAQADLSKVNEALMKPVKPNVNFSLKQEKVNIYGKDQAGLVPVSSLLITRQGIRNNGEVSKNPWTVKISNFKAKPVEHAGGTTSYSGQTATEKREAFIMVTDEAMFNCCHRVRRFMETWENAFCIPLIAEAVEAKNRARLEAAANRT